MITRFLVVIWLTATALVFIYKGSYIDGNCIIDIPMEAVCLIDKFLISVKIEAILMGVVLLEAEYLAAISLETVS